MSTVRVTDGVTYVSFNSASHAAWKINPPSGGIGQQSVECVLTTGENARIQMSAVERLFAQARRRYDADTRMVKEPAVLRVFVEVDLTGAGTDYWRTEVYDGSCDPVENVNIYAESGYARFALNFTHAPWWEGAEAAVPISNGNGSNVTSGLTVNNHTSGSASSFFRIGAGVIAGNLPARCRMELTVNDATAAGNFYIGLLNDSDSYTGVIQAEDSSVGTLVSDGARSGGAASSFVVSPGSEHVVLRLTIPTAIMASLAGRRARPVLVYSPSASYTDVQARWEIFYLGNTKVAETPWATLTFLWGIHDGETLPIPPKWLAGSAGYANHELWLRMRKLGSGSITITSDFVQLIPAGPFRKLTPAGFGILQNSVMVDDGIEEVTFVGVGGASGARAGHYQALSSQWFELIPGAAHTFCVLHASLSGNPAITRTLTARLYYRPRRATLS